MAARHDWTPLAATAGDVAHGRRWEGGTASFLNGWEGGGSTVEAATAITPAVAQSMPSGSAITPVQCVRLSIAARVRPVLPVDAADGITRLWPHGPSRSIVLLPPLPSYAGQPVGRKVESILQACRTSGLDGHVSELASLPGARRFMYDAVHGHAASQAEVYRISVAAAVGDVLAGVNAVILCYGQTGSGKTHTIFGPDVDAMKVTAEDASHLGTLPRAVHDLFERLELRSSLWEFDVQVTYVQLYCDAWFDLLAGVERSGTVASGGGSAPAAIPTPAAASRHAAHNVREVLWLLHAGHGHKATSAMRLNQSSSRGHTIFRLHLTRRLRPPATGATTSSPQVAALEEVGTSSLMFLDLAGSERVRASGAMHDNQRMLEARFINTSLHALGRVLAALASTTAAATTAAATAVATAAWVAGKHGTTTIHAPPPARGRSGGSTAAHGRDGHGHRSGGRGNAGPSEAVAATAAGRRLAMGGHVPWRSSKLTHFLFTVLAARGGGGGRSDEGMGLAGGSGAPCSLTLILCLAPTDTHAAESLSTCVFGARAHAFAEALAGDVQATRILLNDATYRSHLQSAPAAAPPPQPPLRTGMEASYRVGGSPHDPALLTSPSRSPTFHASHWGVGGEEGGGGGGHLAWVPPSAILPASELDLVIDRQRTQIGSLTRQYEQLASAHATLLARLEAMDHGGPVTGAGHLYASVARGEGDDTQAPPTHRSRGRHTSASPTGVLHRTPRGSGDSEEVGGGLDLEALAQADLPWTLEGLIHWPVGAGGGFGDEDEDGSESGSDQGCVHVQEEEEEEEGGMNVTFQAGGRSPDPLALAYDGSALTPALRSSAAATGARPHTSPTTIPDDVVNKLQRLVPDTDSLAALVSVLRSPGAVNVLGSVLRGGSPTHRTPTATAVRQRASPPPATAGSSRLGHGLLERLTSAADGTRTLTRSQLDGDSMATAGAGHGTTITTKTTAPEPSPPASTHARATSSDHAGPWMHGIAINNPAAVASSLQLPPPPTITIPAVPPVIPSHPAVESVHAALARAKMVLARLRQPGGGGSTLVANPVSVPGVTTAATPMPASPPPTAQRLSPVSPPRDPSPVAPAVASRPVAPTPPPQRTLSPAPPPPRQQQLQPAAGSVSTTDTVPRRQPVPPPPRRPSTVPTSSTTTDDRPTVSPRPPPPRPKGAGMRSEAVAQGDSRPNPHPSGAGGDATAPLPTPTHGVEDSGEDESYTQLTAALRTTRKALRQALFNLGEETGTATLLSPGAGGVGSGSVQLHSHGYHARPPPASGLDTVEVMVDPAEVSHVAQAHHRGGNGMGGGVVGGRSKPLPPTTILLAATSTGQTMSSTAASRSRMGTGVGTPPARTVPSHALPPHKRGSSVHATGVAAAMATATVASPIDAGGNHVGTAPARLPAQPNPSVTHGSVAVTLPAPPPPGMAGGGESDAPVEMGSGTALAHVMHMAPQLPSTRRALPIPTVPDAVAQLLLATEQAARGLGPSSPTSPAPPGSLFSDKPVPLTAGPGDAGDAVANVRSSSGLGPSVLGGGNLPTPPAKPAPPRPPHAR